MRLVIHPTDRLHMLVWRAYPTANGDPGWRAARALNGIPISFGVPFGTWSEAVAYALQEAY